MRFLSELQRKEVGFQYVLDSLNIITPFGMDEKKTLNHTRRKIRCCCKESLIL